jgi:hypothetical protein
VRRIPVAEEDEPEGSNYDPALRVPPLSLLDAPAIEGKQPWSVERLQQSASAFWLAVSAFIGRYWEKMTTYVKGYLPKSYSLAQGTHTDWHTAIARGVKRVAIPLGAMAILLVAALSLPGEQSPAPGTTSPHSAQGHSPTVKVENTGNNAATGSSTNTSNSTSTGAGTTNGTNSTPATFSSGSSSTSIPITYYPQSGSTTGGKGGGSTSPPTTNTGTQSPTPTDPTTGNIPGVTSPYPITIPGQTLNVGDKQIISTSPITTTLN